MGYLENLFSLRGKVALLTGGAGILAEAVARGLGWAGARLVITDLRSPQERVAMLRAEGLEAWGYPMDVLKRAEIEGVAERIRRDVGPVDILVNLAGGNLPEATAGPDQPFFDLPLEALERKPLGRRHSPLPSLRPANGGGRRGGIINIASMAAFRPLTRVVGYAAARRR